MTAQVRYMGLAACIALAALWGCVQEEYNAPIVGGGELSLSMTADDLIPGELKSRAGSARVAKENEEMEIKTLHVFIFGSDENYIEPAEDHRYQGYTYLTGTSMLRIDKEGFLNPSLAESATVCVVANVETGTFNVPQGDNHPEEIKNLQDFRDFYYLPKNYQGMLFNLPAEGMPMVSITEGVNLVNRSGIIDIELKALMARIDVNLSIYSNTSTTEQPTILLKNVTMHNMPQGAGFTAPAGETPNQVTLKNSEPVVPGGTSTIYNRQTGKALSFYVFENIRDDNGKLDEEVYPQDENFKEEYKQRYKPLFAKEEATYARFDCLFTSYNGLTYDVTYDLYFGGNNTKDFKIKRNNIYTNNVMIKGLVNVGDSDDKVIFDYRVNVNTETNAYFVSCLRERQLDAHFNVFPMDVYVMESGCKVRIEIVDPVTTDWIRMEYIPAENMANGTVPSNLEGLANATRTAYTAGNGKRDFFVTNLVTNTLSGNTSYDMGHRDRVYFYVDEFLSTREMRQAMIRISLIAPDGSTVRESYDVEFDQYGLLPVTVRTGSWDDGYPGDGETIYMERFEEYLNFSDPLEEYASDFVYSGLPWGASGDEIGRGPSSIAWRRCFNNYYNGKPFTQLIVNQSNDNFSLNDSPSTAAGYCMNKNKRSDTNGNINESDYHWFMPGIRQLESCLTQYYYNYDEFQHNFYWSSAAAKVSGFLTTNEETSRARATKVKGFETDNEGNIVAIYAESGSENNDDNYTNENGEGGRALRSTSLRIRACYVGAVSNE